MCTVEIRLPRSSPGDQFDGPVAEPYDLRHTFAVHVLETWVREGKDLRQKLPVLSGYMAHALLKSTELYLRLVPDRFVKPLARLQEPTNRGKDGIV
jgi:integrase